MVPPKAKALAVKVCGFSQKACLNSTKTVQMSPENSTDTPKTVQIPPKQYVLFKTVQTPPVVFVFFIKSVPKLGRVVGGAGGAKLG